MRSQGNPHNTLRVFHVAGTNGKGSVCNMLAQVLHQAFGKHVGLFTSPHLVRINERIKIDGQEITDSDLMRLTEKVVADQSVDDPFTFFELITLVAIFYFVEQGLDYAVIEVGV